MNTHPSPPPKTATSQEARQAKIMMAALWYQSEILVSSHTHRTGPLDGWEAKELTSEELIAEMPF